MSGGRAWRKAAWGLAAVALMGAATAVAQPSAEQMEGVEKDALAAVPAERVRPLEPGPKPKAASPVRSEDLESAIHRGVEFLLARQNKNGSWGSAHTEGLELYAPVPGSHHAFRAAVTSLALSALVELDSKDVRVHQAIDRGETWLLEYLPKLRRADETALYNNWGHAYGVMALARLAGRHAGHESQRKEVLRQLELQVGLLSRYECVDGGWCYYDFNCHTQQPSGSSIGFVTAAVLVSLADAREAAGLTVPKRLIDRAMASMRRQRKPDFCYDYGEYLKYVPMMGINRPAGSLGRSQACNLAMRLWGDRLVTDEVLSIWLDRLFARNLWLDIGRKRPIPHESWFQVAGYFFYFGHYYAARCIDELEPAKRTAYQDHLAGVLLRLQEKDGSWWDFPLFDYHQQYGTSFAVMALLRCRHGKEPPPEAR